ncbi:hypothetical protein ACEWY4_024918 [Coilia grayii]|uniref:BTB domain-containing protein n=1 Tax=Coilia grayii TaxID=363190 RepID=A0ABD1IWB6_9TELE
MALAAACNPSDWGSPWRDRGEESGVSRRISETSSEEGWERSHDHEGPSEDSDDGVDQEEDTRDGNVGYVEAEGLVAPSHSRHGYDGSDDADDNDDDDDDAEEDKDEDHNDSCSEGGLRGGRTSHLDEAGVSKITGCEDHEELGKKRGEGDSEDSDTEKDEADDDGQEDDQETSQYCEEEEEWCDEDVNDDDDDEDDEDPEDTKILYRCPTYATEVFETLQNFRHSDVLTDMIFCTWYGQRFRAHSPIIAAISSLIEQKLRIQGRWSQSDIYVSLGPEVTPLGLASVLEFAYTGDITDLDAEAIMHIRPTAQCLCMQRVLDLCVQKEEEWKKEKEKKKKKKKKEEDAKMAERNGEEQKTEKAEEKGEEKTTALTAEKQLEITLQDLRELWVEKVGCDIILQADRRTFHTHRVILAACSDYFRAMFTNGLKETKQWAVRLQSMREEDLEVFLLCCYSGSMVLSWGWVFDLVCAAIQFQIQPAMSICLDFIRQEMDAFSCLDVASFAEAYDMEELFQYANDFVLRHFQDVSTTPKFLDLPRIKLLQYLESNALSVPSEIIVLRAVMSWIAAYPRWRVKMARELIDTIKFPLLTFKEFNEVQAIAKWPQKSMHVLYDTLMEEFCSVKKGDQNSFRDYLPVDNMVLVGGDGITPDLGNRRASRELWYSNSLRNHTGIVKDVEWRPLGELPDKPKFCHEVAVLDDKLYVCGGRHYYGTDDVMKSMFRYDPVDGRWRTCADMLVNRCQFAMVVVNGMIYAIGGERAANLNVDSVERYCPNTDSWSFVCPLDQPMSSHAASVWEGQIYVSGGFNCEYQCLVSMFLYHPERGTTYLADMPSNRAQHRMELLGDRLYVIGGVSTNDVDGLFDQLSCEAYSPESDFWWRISPVPTPHVGAASAVLEGKVYILGGYCQADYSECQLIHRYDPAIEHWENMGGMPGPITDIRACSIRLPSHLRE